MNDLQYQLGFRSHLATEALPGALPKGQNSPQRCPYGLYAEQLSGTAFTAPRHRNLRSWLYRIRPTVVQADYRECAAGQLASAPFDRTAGPNQMRWNPLPMPSVPTDFLDGLFTFAGNGDVDTRTGIAVHMYACNKDMTDRFFYNADGELLVVPQQGRLQFRTELGLINMQPGEITVIPRGIRFQVRINAQDKTAHGYVCENYGVPFELPDLGSIGANGLANSRDFLSPAAYYEDQETPCELYAKHNGKLWRCELEHSPLDVVAWHGNYAPYKYDLSHFNVINTVSFDHPDPSIFTVLTSPSEIAGTANCDFVIFPPRWMVGEHTFRPPWFHRNVMSEFMGLVTGEYDARAEGFLPGGASLHNCMSPHGPDAQTFERASNAELQPQYVDDTLAFMFESRFVLHPTQVALDATFRQKDYVRVWDGLQSRFNPDEP